MQCKKCKKECLDSELENGVCRECSLKEKGNRKVYILIILISVVLSTICYLTIETWVNNDVTLKDFEIGSFNMETEKTNYQYTSNFTTYTGTGQISCKNKNTDYIVLLETNNKTTGKVEYTTVIVHEGKGEFTTYDSNYSNVDEKPNYEFKVIGYRNFKNVK